MVWKRWKKYVNFENYSKTTFDYFSKSFLLFTKREGMIKINKWPKIMKKILRFLDLKFDFVIIAIEESKGLEQISLEQLMNSSTWTKAYNKRKK